MLCLFEAVFKLKELIERVRERVAEAKEERLEFPVRSPLAAKYQQLESIQRKLDDQNEAIFNRELELGRVRNELASATGIFRQKRAEKPAGAGGFIGTSGGKHEALAVRHRTRVWI